jgi:hypothetical protein
MESMEAIQEMLATFLGSFYEFLDFLGAAAYGFCTPGKQSIPGSFHLIKRNLFLG